MIEYLNSINITINYYTVTITLLTPLYVDSKYDSHSLN